LIKFIYLFDKIYLYAKYYVIVANEENCDNEDHII